MKWLMNSINKFFHYAKYIEIMIQYIHFRTKLPSSAVSTMSYVNSPQENGIRSGRNRLGQRVGGSGLSPSSSDIENSTANNLSLIRIRDE